MVTTAQCGLYYAESAASPVPLQNIRYSVEVRGPVALVTLQQNYVNTTGNSANVTYCFPKSKNSCFYSFEAIFQGRKVIGQVKEKEQAKQEFKEHKAAGHFVGYAELKTDSPDIVKVDLGNFPSGESLTINFAFAEQLDLVANQMWRLIIPSTLTPRYTLSETQKAQLEKSISTDTSSQTEIIEGITYYQNLPYTWDISVKIFGSEPADHVFCGTHKDCVTVLQTEGVTELSLKIGRASCRERV